MPTVAAIDVGSNATRFALLTVSAHGVAQPLQLQRFSIRLGADVFAQGSLGPHIRGTLREAFATMAQAMREAEVTAYRAVATSAMRDAGNADAVVREVREQTGVDLEIISGLEESRLSRDALVRAMGSVQPGALIVDLGGGSLELDRPGSRRGRSLPLGTVRLLQRFPQLRAPVATDELMAIRRVLAAELRAVLRRAAQSPLAIGTGGNLELLSQLVGCADTLVPRIRLAALPDFVQTLAALSVEARIAQYGLRPDRADLIVPASLVILALHDVMGIKTLAVPKTGLRDGLLFTLVATQAQRHGGLRLTGSTPWQRRARARLRWLNAVFARLAPLHHLWPPALLPLQAALLAAAHNEADSATAASLTPLHALPQGSRVWAEAVVQELGPRGDAAPKLSPAAAVVRLARCFADAAAGAPPDLTVDLLTTPLTLTCAQADAVSEAESAAVATAFGRPLVLRTRSH